MTLILGAVRQCMRNLVENAQVVVKISHSDTAKSATWQSSIARPEFKETKILDAQGHDVKPIPLR